MLCIFARWSGIQYENRSCTFQSSAERWRIFRKTKNDDNKLYFTCDIWYLKHFGSLIMNLIKKSFWTPQFSAKWKFTKMKKGNWLYFDIFILKYFRSLLTDLKSESLFRISSTNHHFFFSSAFCWRLKCAREILAHDSWSAEKNSSDTISYVNIENFFVWLSCH